MRPSYRKFESLMRQKGENQFKVAQESGVFPTTLSDWKNGKSCPGVSNLYKLAKHFHSKIEDLLE